MHPLTRGEEIIPFPETIKRVSMFEWEIEGSKTVLACICMAEGCFRRVWGTGDFHREERWIKTMVEAGIEADDQRGIGGQSRVKTLYATDSRHPLSLPVEKNRSTDMRPGIIRWRLFSPRRSRLIEYPARKFVRIPIENGRSDVSIEMQGDDLLGFWTNRQGASEQRENKRGRGW